jgi:hypothetical protein
MVDGTQEITQITTEMVSLEDEESCVKVTNFISQS